MKTTQSMQRGIRFKAAWPSVLAVGVVLCGALWLRVAALGQPSLDSDEYLHALSAERAIKGEGYRLPSGAPYERAMPYTRLVATSFRLFGVSESSARLPSMVFGMLTVLLTYLVGRRWFGFWPALVAAALVAGSPFLVESSRTCRMYSMFHVLYLGLIFAYQQGWEQQGVALRRRTLWTGFAILCFWAALSVHLLTLDALPAIAAYWVGLTLVKWRSRYSLWLLIAVLLVSLGTVTGFIHLGELWERANHVGSWAEGRRYDYGYYWMHWGSAYPVLWWLGPLAAGFAWFKYRKIGFYLVCQFVVPFLLHSFIFDWKAVRYIGHLFPIYALMIAPLLVWCSGILTTSHHPVIERIAHSVHGWKRGLCWAVVVVFVSLPWAPRAIALQHISVTPQWRAGFASVAEDLLPGDVAMTTHPNALAYYLDHSATHMLNNVTAKAVERKGGAARDAQGLMVHQRTALPMVTSIEEFERVRSHHVRGWVIVDRPRFTSTRVVPLELQRYIRKRCRAYPVVADGSVLVFGWDETTDEAIHTAQVRKVE